MNTWAPLPYMHQARLFLEDRPAAALWLDMGMRKTSITATAMLDCLDVTRWLVVGPKRVVEESWPNELRKWRHLAGLQFRVLTAADFDLTPTKHELPDGTTRRGALTFTAKRETKKALQQWQEPVHLIAYDLLQFLVRTMGVNWPYQGVILDEADGFQDHESLRFGAIKHSRPRIKRLYELTGTPAGKGLEDLWAQIYLLDGGHRLGATLTEFRDRFMCPDKRNKQVIYSWKPRPGKKEEIFSLVADICMSLKTEDYLQLPERVFNNVAIDLPASARAAYDEIHHELIVAIGDGVVIAPNAGVLAGKLHQITNGAVYDGDRLVLHLHDAKLDVLEELIEATPGPALVAFGYQHDAQRLVQRFGKKLTLASGVTDLERRWNAGEFKILAAHPASIGHGLNMQEGGSNMFWFSLTSNLRHYQQFNKRLHRSGQKADRVVINNIVVRDTIDERLLQVLQTREDVQDALLEATRR